MLHLGPEGGKPSLLIIVDGTAEVAVADGTRTVPFAEDSNPRVFSLAAAISGPCSRSPGRDAQQRRLCRRDELLAQGHAAAARERDGKGANESDPARAPPLA
eukprot:2506075-Prymnesium_polylepis.2